MRGHKVEDEVSPTADIQEQEGQIIYLARELKQVPQVLNSDSLDR